MGDTEEPGRHMHPRGGYTRGMFSGVSSPDDFAAVLCVPKKAIGCIRPQNTKCKTKDCPFKQIRNNGGQCPAHQRSWYPLSKNCGGNLHGKGTDVMLTEKTQILRQILFGHTGKVDKGFIIDDLAAAKGVVIDRPQKKKEHQLQQSSVDTSQTQKIGNTRIFVECVIGSFKLQIRYLNVLIPTLQFGVLSKIVRIGYIRQNIKKALTHERGEVHPNGGAGRTSRAEIRWYGASDDSLRDVRHNVRDRWS